MSEIITAVYENGILRPLSPLPLPSGSTVRLQILAEESATEEPATEGEQIIQSLVAAGLLTPAPLQDDIKAVSEQARRELAQKLAQRPGKSLSEIIIEDRGSW
jgi:predicted DNA-binding antitoxin AbrB/MazE fold protein